MKKTVMFWFLLVSFPCGAHAGDVIITETETAIIVEYTGDAKEAAEVKPSSESVGGEKNKRVRASLSERDDGGRIPPPDSAKLPDQPIEKKSARVPRNERNEERKARRPKNIQDVPEGNE